MGRNLSALLIGISLLVFASGKARAYPTPVDFDGSRMRWPINIDSAPITYDINADNPEDLAYYQPAIDDAANMWGEVPGSYFKYQPAPAGQKGQVTVYLRSSLSGVRETAGYTIFDKYSGDVPLHCSIYVQTSIDISYYVLAKVFLHEFGHGLGLGHSLVPEAIMSYSLDKNSFALDLDDNAAAAHNYPADGHTPHLPPGCAVLGQEQGVRYSLQHWLLIVLLSSPLLLSRFSRWPTSGRWRSSP